MFHLTICRKVKKKNDYVLNAKKDNVIMLKKKGIKTSVVWPGCDSHDPNPSLCICIFFPYQGQIANLKNLTFAVRETGVSRHHGYPIEDPRKTPQYNSARGFWGPSIVPPWCRDTPVSRTATNLITVVFPAYQIAYLCEKRCNWWDNRANIGLYHRYIIPEMMTYNSF